MFKYKLQKRNAEMKFSGFEKPLKKLRFFQKLRAYTIVLYYITRYAPLQGVSESITIFASLLNKEV